MIKVRHILGISGGKDSAALAIYLKKTYPSLKIEYYNSDTGCELAETETLINRLEAYLGKIERLRAAEGSPEPTPFHHFLKAMGGFLPSPQARWCTKKMHTLAFVAMRTEMAISLRSQTSRPSSHSARTSGVSTSSTSSYIMRTWSR